MALLIGVTVNLLPQWRHNPDLPHGWFTPLVFLLLIHEARTRGAQRFLPSGARTAAAIFVLLLGGLALLTAGGLYLAALEWTHALVAAMLTAAGCALLAAAWIYFSLKEVRFVPFNWPAGVAIFLWLLSAPLPPGTYGTLTHGLQAGVTGVVLAVLHFLGIAAVQHGNIIQLTTVSVGVEEACSGVRSLVSCVYAGFFFSATLVRGAKARALIIALAAPLAVAMNLVRSLTLTLLAHHGVDITGGWHDVTGFAVLGVTSAVLAGLAVMLERRPHTTPAPLQPHAMHTAESPSPRAETAPNASAVRLPRCFVAVGLTLALLVAGLFVVNTRPISAVGRAALDPAALLPTHFAGWTVSRGDDLFRFTAQLQTDRLAQTTYHRETPDGPLHVTVYLAYWPASRVPVSFVAAHTPDACWPGSGWSLRPLTSARVPMTLPNHLLEEAEYRVFTQLGQAEHVWYWHLHDGRVIHPKGVRSPRQLLLLAFKYGFHRDGTQLFVRVSSNQPWNVITNEPLVQEIFAQLAPHGL